MTCLKLLFIMCLCWTMNDVLDYEVAEEHIPTKPTVWIDFIVKNGISFRFASIHCTSLQIQRSEQSWETFQETHCLLIINYSAFTRFEPSSSRKGGKQQVVVVCLRVCVGNFVLISLPHELDFTLDTAVIGGFSFNGTSVWCFRQSFID